MLPVLLLCLWVPCLAQADLSRVGAVTPFNQANSLDLATYCNGADAVADHDCMNTWLSDAFTQGKHAYVSAGTYIVGADVYLRNGTHIKCASPAVTFKIINDRSTVFRMLDSNSGPEPWSDISLETCGFDMNASQANFAGVIQMAGQTALMRYVTIRGLRVYDSTQRGSMYPERERQRQYILVLNASDVLIENNDLSEGGRIKAGRPGKRVVIRNNRLENINDNGITVVNRNDTGDLLSHDFLVENNYVLNPIGSGVFFGTDGQQEGIAGLTFTDVTIRNNTIIGDWLTGCITGTLPDIVARISITHNYCLKTANSTENGFTGGILLSRDVAGFANVEQVTVRNNILTSTLPNGLTIGFSPIFAYVFPTTTGGSLCILNNDVTNNAGGIRVRNAQPAVLKITGNTLHGGSVVLDNMVADTSGNVDGCFMPSRGAHRTRR